MNRSHEIQLKLRFDCIATATSGGLGLSISYRTYSLQIKVVSSYPSNDPFEMGSARAIDQTRPPYGPTILKYVVRTLGEVNLFYSKWCSFVLKKKTNSWTTELRLFLKLVCRCFKDDVAH